MEPHVIVAITHRQQCIEPPISPAKHTHDTAENTKKHVRVSQLMARKVVILEVYTVASEAAQNHVSRVEGLTSIARVQNCVLTAS